MTIFLLILKIVPWILSAVGVGVGLLQRKKIKNQKATISLKEFELHSLRDQIVELVELQGEKNEVKGKVKKGKKNINSVSDDQLGIDYAGKLSNVPKRKTSRKK